MRMYWKTQEAAMTRIRYDVMGNKVKNDVCAFIFILEGCYGCCQTAAPRGVKFRRADGGECEKSGELCC